MASAVARVIGAAGVVLIAVACYDTTTDLRVAPLYRTYKAVQLAHCPVPFTDTMGPANYVWEGADLVLYDDERVALTFFSYLRGMVDVVGDTFTVSGSYRRDGFSIEMVFDSAYARPVRYRGQVGSDGHLHVHPIAALIPSGMQFVPAEDFVPPTGTPPQCDA